MPNKRGAEARVRDLIDRLRTIPEGDERATHFVAKELPALVGADFSAVCRPEREAEGWKLGLLETFEYPEPEKFRARLIDFLASAPPRFALYNLDRPEPEQRNRAVRPKALVDRATWLDCPLVRDFLVPLDLERLDPLRLLVCDGPFLLSSVGAFRERPFTDKEVALLARVQPALAARLRLERQLLHARLYWGCLTATLDALTAPAFLLVAGAVEHMNHSGRALVEADRGGLEAVLAGPEGGHRSRAQIEISGVSPIEVCIVHEPRPDLQRRLGTAHSSWRLTPAEARVLRYLVLGDANKTIANKLACAEVTVEYHVTRLMRKATVGGRAELLSRFWTAI